MPFFNVPSVRPLRDNTYDATISGINIYNNYNHNPPDIINLSQNDKDQSVWGVPSKCTPSSVESNTCPSLNDTKNLHTGVVYQPLSTTVTLPPTQLPSQTMNTNPCYATNDFQLNSTEHLSLDWDIVLSQLMKAQSIPKRRPDSVATASTVATATEYCNEDSLTTTTNCQLRFPLQPLLQHFFRGSQASLSCLSEYPLGETGIISSSDPTVLSTPTTRVNTNPQHHDLIQHVVNSGNEHSILSDNSDSLSRRHITKTQQKSYPTHHLMQLHSFNGDDFQNNHSKSSTTTSNLSGIDTIQRDIPVKLFVNRVPKWMSNAQLRNVFSPYGDVVDCSILKDSRGPKGCAFVKYSSIADSQTAITTLHGKRILNADAGPVQIKYADGELARLGLSNDFQPGGDSVKVFVGCLPKSCNEDDLFHLFSQFGRVDEVYVLRDHMKQSKCSAFVTFPKADMASAAINALDRQYIFQNGRRAIEVRLAESKWSREKTSRGNKKVSQVQNSESIQFHKQQPVLTQLDDPLFNPTVLNTLLCSDHQHKESSIQPTLSFSAIPASFCQSSEIMSPSNNLHWIPEHQPDKQKTNNTLMTQQHQSHQLLHQQPPPPPAISWDKLYPLVSPRPNPSSPFQDTLHDESTLYSREKIDMPWLDMFTSTVTKQTSSNDHWNKMPDTGIPDPCTPLSTFPSSKTEQHCHTQQHPGTTRKGVHQYVQNCSYTPETYTQHSTIHDWSPATFANFINTIDQSKDVNSFAPNVSTDDMIPLHHGDKFFFNISPTERS